MEARCVLCEVRNVSFYVLQINSILQRVVNASCIAVGMVTSYGVIGPGIESRWRWEFPHLSRPACGPPNLQYNEYRILPGVKRPERGLDRPLPSNAEVKEGVQLYI